MHRTADHAADRRHISGARDLGHKSSAVMWRPPLTHVPTHHRHKCQQSKQYHSPYYLAQRNLRQSPIRSSVEAAPLIQLSAATTTMVPQDVVRSCIVAGRQSDRQKDWHTSTNNAKGCVTTLLEEAQSPPERFTAQRWVLRYEALPTRKRTPGLRLMCCASECMEAEVQLTWFHESHLYESSRILRQRGGEVTGLLRSNCANSSTSLASASARGHACSWCCRTQKELL
jgi:hypothetical protein